VEIVSRVLSVEDTRALLQDVPAVFEVPLVESLLTALHFAIREWTGSVTTLLDVEGHGREDLFDDVDLSRTLGWFTTIFPLNLSTAMDSNAVDALRTIHHQFRAVPKRGIGYGLLRYTSNSPENGLQLRSQPQAEIAFNYLGHLDH
jgi:hypothetical protein